MKSELILAILFAAVFGIRPGILNNEPIVEQIKKYWYNE